MLNFLISLPMIVLAIIALFGLFQPKWVGVCWPLFIGSCVGQLALFYSLQSPVDAITVYVAIDSVMAAWLAIYAVRFKNEEAMAQAAMLVIAVCMHAILSYDVVFEANIVYDYYEFTIAFITFLQCYLLRGVFNGFFEEFKSGSPASSTSNSSSTFFASFNRGVMGRDKKE